MPADSEAKPLQAQFNVGDEEFEVEEGIGFSPDEEYTFTLDREPTGKYMMYGKSPKPIVIDGKSYDPKGLFVLGKKIPKELQIEYLSHPDSFDIFHAGEINGQQALVPGADFEKFKPFMSQIANVGWKCKENGRLVFMQLSFPPRVNPSHPEFENDIVHLARKIGYEPPVAKINGKPNPEKFSMVWLHTGIEIKAKTVMVKNRDPQFKDTVAIVIDSIELVGGEDNAVLQKKISTDDIPSEMKVAIMEAAEGCTTDNQVFKKMLDAAKKDKKTYSATEKTKILDYIKHMKDSEEILTA